VNPAGGKVTIDFSKLVGLTIDASNNPIGGSALPGNSILVIGENGTWTVTSGNTSKTGTYAATNWSLGSNVTQKIAVNLAVVSPTAASIDVFTANGASTSGLTGVGTLGFDNQASLGSTAKATFAAPDRSSAWFGGVETTTAGPPTGITGALLSQVSANNGQFNGSLGGTNDNVFARVYDRYLVSNKGSSVDNQFIDNNNAGDWTYGSSKTTPSDATAGAKNAVFNASGRLTAVPNSLDALDDVNPKQGTNVHGSTNASITNEDGQTVAVINGSTVLHGGAGADFLYGLGTADTIFGDGGNDYIYGGGGGDALAGGAGADRFVYLATSESAASATDLIADFTAAIDKLDLLGIGAVPLAFQAAQLATSIGAGSIGWKQAGGITSVYVNTSAGSENLSSADMTIRLTGTINLTGTDILHH